MRIFQQLKVLKWCFLLIFFFNIFFIISGVGFIVYYNKANNSIVSSNNQLLKENLLITDSILKLNSSSPPYSKKLIYNLFELEKSHYKPVEFNWAEKLLQQGLKKGLGQKNKNQLITDLNTWISNNYARLSKTIITENRFKNLFIAAVIISFLFGIILPLVLIGMISKKLYQAQLLVQNTCVTALREWKQLKEHTPQTFSVEFWLKTVLICTKTSSAFSQHPVLIFFNDLSQILLTELNSNSGPQPSTNAEGPRTNS